MGMCQYCGERPGEFEIVDDDFPSGVAMVCLQCHPDQNFVKNILETDEENKTMLKPFNLGKEKENILKAIVEQNQKIIETNCLILKIFSMVTLENSPSEETIDAARMLLGRIQDEKGTGFWGRKPSTDLEKAAQALAKLIPPE